MAEIMTARGPIDANICGRTLTHEHVMINLLREIRVGGLLNDTELMKRELEAFVNSGGSTIIELTSAELTIGASPDPDGRFRGVPASGYPEHGTRTLNHVLTLLQLSEATNVNLVLGTGHYRDPYFDDGWVDGRSTDSVAERMITDLTEGFPGTSVRAGIIGEIGAEKWYISAAEERSFRAAAKAHHATGATITTHASRWPVGIPQLDLLTAEGVDPSRVIIGHCDGVNIPEYHLEIARRGAYVQFDAIRGSSAYDTELQAGFVVQLRNAGYLGQILLSQDVSRRAHLRLQGGCGFTYIFDEFVAIIQKHGLDDAEVEQLLVANPRCALTG